MSDPILLNDRPSQPKVSPGKQLATALWLGRWLAIGLVIASLLDLGALWYPIQLGKMEWEYTTIATTFDSLPLITVGLGFLAAMALGQGRRNTVVALGALFVLMTVLIGSMLVIFSLDVTVAIQAAPVAAKGLVKEASLKAVLTGTTYTVLYLGAAFALLRRRD